MGMESNKLSWIEMKQKPSVQRRAEDLIAHTMWFYDKDRDDPSSGLYKLTKLECSEIIKQAQQENPDWPEYDGWSDSLEREQFRWLIEANRKGKTITLKQALEECFSPYPVHI